MMNLLFCNVNLDPLCMNLHVFMFTSKYARALQRDRIMLYIVMKYTLIYLELEKRSYSHETGGSKLIVSV
jgi:hypothetical protein